MVYPVGVFRTKVASDAQLVLKAVTLTFVFRSE